MMETTEEYKYFENFYDYVRYEMSANKGTKTLFIRELIESLYAESTGKDDCKKLGKEEMVDIILEKVNYLEIYNNYSDKFGIKPRHWKNKFNLTDHQMKKMLKENFLLEFSFDRYEKVFTNTYKTVTYYKAYNYFNTTVEEVEEWKIKNIRGYKGKK